MASNDEEHGSKRKGKSMENPKTKVRRTRASGCDITLVKIRGPKIKKVLCDESKSIHSLKIENLKTWGVVLYEGSLFLCVEGSALSVVIDYKITGSLFKRNLGLEDFQECLCLLMENVQDGNKLAVCLRLPDYTKFDQLAIEGLLKTSTKYTDTMSTDLEFPLTPEKISGEDISTYITDILEWSKKPYVRLFSLGRKGEIGPGHLPEELNDDKAKELFNNLLNEYRDITLFAGESFEVETMRCKLAPDDYKCRSFDKKYCEALKGSMMGHSSIALEKKIVYLVPIHWDATLAYNDLSYNGTPFTSRPTRADLANCYFWIVGGQHTIEAYKLLLADPKFSSARKSSLMMVTASMFWTPFSIVGNTKIMGLSQALNNMNRTTMPDSQFLLMAKQLRSIWVSSGRPTPTRGQSANSMWKVCIFLLW